MIITPVPHGLDLLKSDLVRSKGVHASDIYGDFYKKLEPKRYDYPETEDDPLLMVLGTAWEKHFEYLLEANGIAAIRPGELMSPEGIAYSPDLIIFNGHTRVGEIKLTSMSPDDFPKVKTDAGFPPKLNKYMAQMKLYAVWLELLYGWIGILSIRKSYKPELLCFNIEWTIRELKENYDMLIGHGRHEGMIK